MPAPPEIRNGFLTIAQAQKVLAKKPSWLRDLNGDLQMHSQWSDGSATVKEIGLPYFPGHRCPWAIAIAFYRTGVGVRDSDWRTARAHPEFYEPGSIPEMGVKRLRLREGQMTSRVCALHWCSLAFHAGMSETFYSESKSSC